MSVKCFTLWSSKKEQKSLVNQGVKAGCDRCQNST